jgi:glutamate racemase
MDNGNRPIGIFDSGVGGLTVVKEVIRELPNEGIIYVGDTARVPYGSKTPQTVTRYASQIMRFLLRCEVKAVIIACGTVSSNSYDELRRNFDVPLFEMVSGGVKACLDATKNGRVGVIATDATVRSGKYERLLKAERADIEVYSKACPLFVPLAEEGWTDNRITELTAEEYLSGLREKGIDSLILACTHYPLLSAQIKKVVGNARLINPAEETARSVRSFLSQNNLLRPASNEPQHKFYITDNTEKFNQLSKLILTREYEAILVDLEHKRIL